MIEKRQEGLGAGGREEDLGFDRPLSFSGRISRLLFRNQENGYSVVDLEGEGDSWTLVGVMPQLTAGDRVTGQGVLTDHPSYGPQIRVLAIFKEEPRGRNQIESYLSSGAVKGIGPVTAKRLVDTFGEETLTVIRQEPHRLLAIRGISARKAEEFSRQLQEDRGFQELLLLLLPHGIGLNRIHRIYRLFGSRSADLISQDPYLLAARVPGIGFLTADKLAQGLGMEGEHPGRLRGAILYSMNERLFREGHTVYPGKDLAADLARDLGLDPGLLEAAIEDLVREGDLVRPADLAGHWRAGRPPFDPGSRRPEELSGPWARAAAALVKDSLLLGEDKGKPELDLPSSDLVSLPDPARLEWGLARKIGDLVREGEGGRHLLDFKEAAGEIDRVAEEEGFKPGREQEEALMMALTRGFSVLTGGPGTGKTSIIRLLTRILKRRGEKVLLAAPTGRAARRLAEVCQMPAQTLHRLLALQVQEDRALDADFWLSADPLECDSLIVDETSMIDLFLFTRLLSAVKPPTRLLLIGDADQLPSIGPGQVLGDLLSSETVPRTRLTRIYRQEAHKLIVSNAHRILEGQALELDQSLESDFLFIDSPDDQAMHEGVIKLCQKVLPDYYGVDGLYGAQVLSAVRRGRAGVNQLNESLQILAQGESFLSVQAYGRRYAIKDKVMQTRNNYDLTWKLVGTGEEGQGVMNGEMGLVVGLDPNKGSVRVLFEEEREVVLQAEDLEDLDLAYAATIHKAQGSEYPVVILVIPPAAPSFLSRNLLYTGITRARDRLFILTRKRILHMMLNREGAESRAGMLAFWLEAGRR